MDKIKKLRSNMKANVIGGLIFLILLFAIVVCMIGYRSIVRAFRNEYSSVTHHMADSAAVFVNGDHIDRYLEGGEQDEYSDTKQKLDIMCQQLNVSLIYVIAVDRSDYGRFVSVFNSVNNSVDDSGYTEWELGYMRDTTNEEYRAKYRAVYEQESAFETVFRRNPGQGVHPHITTIVPVKNESGDVAALLCVQRPVREMEEAVAPYLLRILIGVFIMGIIICILASNFLRRSIILPVEKVSREATRFARESRKGEPLGDISNFDEILDLARSIDTMETDMVDYIENLTAVTAEKERIVAELEIAAKIQNDALPAEFPPFPDRHEFDIYAVMDPAREVGGDFYNFFFTDEDHLALVMADVAGKGIPAALFMMVTNILIIERTQMGGSPSEILSFVNERLCEHNKAEMFVTVWLGILEISTGRLISVNAGHEETVICRESGSFEIIPEKHGFVLGGMEGMQYTEQEIMLSPGDKLFLYTDGVPEATDASNELFGTNRMLDALNSEPDADPKRVLENVLSHIDGFVRDAEQFDDLTMLCLEYLGKDKV